MVTTPGIDYMADAHANWGHEASCRLLRLGAENLSTRCIGATPCVVTFRERLLEVHIMSHNQDHS